MSSAELLGYLAAIVLVAALAGRKRLPGWRTARIVGLVGLLGYGLLDRHGPVVVAAAGLLAVRAWFAYVGRRTPAELSAVVIEADSPFLADFVFSHMSDIRRNQPSFAEIEPGSLALVLFRDGMPAGTLIGRQRGAALEVSLDYVMTAYQDQRIGTWLYGEGSGILRERGIERVVGYTESEYHRLYLEGVGFEPMDGAPGCWVRRLG